MKSIKNNIKNEIIIKNSKFITSLFRLNSEEEIDFYLKKINETYNDATHNCFAYIYENIKKCSDDNEPSGTAGIPMLQVLEKRNITNVLVVVTRYFGGIKLGAGGLVRAYTNSVTEALDNSIIVDLIKGINVDIIFSYDNVKKVDYILKDKKILSKEFNDNIKYNLNIDYETLELLKGIKDIKIIINNEIYID